MEGGIYSGVSALDVGERRMDTISANLANLATPGYKRLGSSTQAFELPGRNGGVRRGLHSGQVIDFSQGSLQRTGNQTDLALMGDGFFAVDGPAGEVYTRRGNFHFDGDGVLKTVEGFPVAWEGGRGTLDATGAAVLIDGSGTVRQGDREVGRLKLVDYADRQTLTFDNQGYFLAAPSAAREQATADVHQGALEASNASAIDEMVQMIQVQRAFQTSSKLMSSIDQTFRRLTQPR
jgi:flagellar basal-body rod protein FlgF